MEKIGKYEDLERIGRGAMGVVYKGFDPFLERPVAIKMMSADFDGEPELLNRFFREARVAVQLKHPNIIDVHDLAEEDGRAYIVMELLDGEDLKEKLKRQEFMPLERKLGMMIDICDALAYAHGQEVIHRDLKPGNIQITSSGQVKILDFGLARIADSDMTATGMVMGTPSYMAPEQLEGEQVDERSDIFALGSLFYELLSYCKAFEGRTLVEAFAKIAREDPTPVHELDPAIPEQLSPIIQRALQKKRDERYQSMQEMQVELEAFRETLPELHEEMRAAAREAIDKLERLKEANRALIASPEGSVDVTADLQTDILELTPASAGAEFEGVGEDVGYLGLFKARCQAEVEYEQLETLLDKLRGIAPYVERDVTELSDDELAKVSAEVEAVLAEYSTNPVATDLRDRLDEERQRRERDERTAEAHAAAQEARKAGELERAAELAGKVLQEDPEHADAKRLAAEVEEERERLEAERREREERERRIAGLMEEAASLQVEGELEKALEKVTDALELDPAHEAAQRLKADVESDLERARKRQQWLASTWAAAQEARKAGELERAAELVARLLEEEPGHADAERLAAEIEQEQERLEAERREAERREREERERRIAELLERAGSLRAEGELKAALGVVREALELDPEREAARELRDEIEGEIEEERQRQRRVAGIYAEAQEARDSGELERAGELAARLLEEEPGHADAERLAAEVEEERERLEQEQERLEAERLEAERREREERERREEEKLEAERRAAEEQAAAEADHRPAKTVVLGGAATDTGEMEAEEVETPQEAAGADEATAAESPAAAVPWQRVSRELLSSVRERPVLLILPLAAIVLVGGLAWWAAGPSAEVSLAPTGPDGPGGIREPGSGGTVSGDPGQPGEPATGSDPTTSGETSDPATEFTEELGTARRQIDDEELGAALTTVDGILEREPDHTEAQALRQRVVSMLVDAHSAEAREHLAEGRYEEALASAQAVLALQPDNAVANQVQRTVRDNLGAQATLGEARAHLEGERFEEAASRAQAVLDGDSGHREARQILERANAGMAMEGARSQLSSARRRAESVGARGAASGTFAEAERLQQEGAEQAAQGRLSEAAETYRSAGARFEAAAEEAASALREAADAAREAYTSRRQQLQTDSGVWGDVDFTAAASRAEEAQAALERGDHAAARSGYENARASLEDTAREALEGLRGEVQDRAQAIEPPVPTAEGRIVAADRAEQGGDLLSAAEALTDAAVHYEEAAAVLSVLARYREAFGDKSLDGIRAVWPGIPGTQWESQIRDLFEAAGDVAVELTPTRTQIDLPRAAYDGTVRYRLDGRSPAPVRQCIQLHKEGGEWRIESMSTMSDGEQCAIVTG